ncbi:spore germination protein [Paenibacillus soyae]|uniref:Spore germination protein n=1 Tax=Paenibacillus soyae TaxID=2969249 RepID=A0A9X2MW65_9BACL|nr:spore germination protein [Paenibacillus soyae]MCR2807449.1 spore germination protein [Paenibacillus soyae]
MPETRNRKDAAPHDAPGKELLDLFSSTEDLVTRSIRILGLEGRLIYLHEMINQTALTNIEQSLTDLAWMQPNESDESRQEHNKMDLLKAKLAGGTSLDEDGVDSLVDPILSGKTVLLFEELRQAFLLPTSDAEGRSIDEPVTDQVVRGPRDGFVELISKNLMLIRRRIKSPDLKVEYITLGKQTRTEIAIVYLKNIANEGIVEEVRKRLSRIEIDGILESNYIEQLIQDAPLSPFPTMAAAERPDRICASLLEGKVAIVTDGTPFVLTAPSVFVEFLHSNEDYYDGAMPASIIRWIRALGLLIATFLPAFYVAITTIHQDLLQTPLLIRIAGYREDLPYPVLVEAFFMQLTFELVREAGLRMPKAIGNAVTIVGTLVIGQAAVQAGLVGALMVIVVAVTALTTFILPNYGFIQVARYTSFPMLILAGLFGFMGIILGLMFILAHLCSLRSFGVPYLSPISPAHKDAWKDVFYRAPWWRMDMRNPESGIRNRRRSRTPIPHPPDPETEGPG